MKKILSVFLMSILVLSLCLPALAMEFVPSIEAKTAPEVPEFSDGKDTYGALVVEKETEKVVERVPVFDPKNRDSELELYVISAAEASQAVLPEITEQLRTALDRLRSVPNLGKLGAGMDLYLQAYIDSFYGSSPDKADIEDLVVSDVFDAALIKDKIQLVQVANGEKVYFALKPTFSRDDFFVMLYMSDEGEWKLVDDVQWVKTVDGYVEINEEGIVVSRTDGEGEDALLVTSKETGVFAFAVEK